MICIIKIYLDIFQILQTRSATQLRAFKSPQQQIRRRVIAVSHT
jgi:hypothetical protein